MFGFDVVDREGGPGNTVLHERPLERTRRGMGIGLEHQLRPLRSFLGYNGDPGVLSQGNVVLQLEAERFRVEAKRLLLVVYQDAGQVLAPRANQPGGLQDVQMLRKRLPRGVDVRRRAHPFLESVASRLRTQLELTMGWAHQYRGNANCDRSGAVQPSSAEFRGWQLLAVSFYDMPAWRLGRTLRVEPYPGGGAGRSTFPSTRRPLNSGCTHCWRPCGSGSDQEPLVAV